MQWSIAAECVWFGDFNMVNNKHIHSFSWGSFEPLKRKHKLECVCAETPLFILFVNTSVFVINNCKLIVLFIVIGRN
eukprot:m.127655 g.127655  ORF g.127655 m.127655 type:complete len:77 (+) comp13014_c5_seq1:2343-2573(+)